MQWHQDNPLRVGDAAQKRSRIVSVKHKSGRSGDLLFVEVEHAFHNAQGLCLTETHDIVYRAAAMPGEAQVPSTPAETDAPWQRAFVPDPVSLFRYSALTFNGHRIHYDRSYVTQEEGYPGLIVHGPLIATCWWTWCAAKCLLPAWPRSSFARFAPLLTCILFI